MPVHNQAGAPNYYPNSFSGPVECPAVRSPAIKICENADRYCPVNEDDFGQVTTFWRDVLDEGAKTRLVNNMVNSLMGASNFIVERAVRNFSQVDVDLGKRLTEGLKKKGKPINVSGKSANL